MSPGPSLTGAREPLRLLLLHSAYGSRPAVREAAKRITDWGLRVHAPDLYHGRCTDRLEEALALRDEVGRETLLERALAEAETFRPDVLLGFSLGASLAHRIFLRGGAARRLILFHGTAEAPSVPQPGRQVLAHIARGDAFEPEDELREWKRAWERQGARVEMELYPGGHLFSDPGLADYEAESARSAWARTREWLRGGSAADGRAA
jgi:dienelactone hydrolase